MLVMINNRVKNGNRRRGAVSFTGSINKIRTRPAGIEPATFWSVARHSIQLSYGRNVLRIIAQNA